MRKEGITGEIADTERMSFRWSYIALPVAFLLLSVVLAAFFYPRLPTELAIHFELDGTPDGWLSREMTMVLVLVPQLLFALLATAVAWGITKIGLLLKSAASTWIKPEHILLFMGNVIALPQLILCFAMLDIFSYNVFQRHIMPFWLFLVITLVLATAALGVLFVLTVLKARQQLTFRPGQGTEEQK